MPYAALLFGSREQQLMPDTQTHILKELFQGGTHIPMFAFAQSKNLGDVFRETGVAFAYTIDEEAGSELEELVNMSKNRIHRDMKDSKSVSWRKKFEKFWKRYGKEMMHKLSGMRDPMLNLMINAPDQFDAMIEDLPASHQKKYARLKK